MINIIDYHTHILPGIDDGSKDEEQSLAMINSLKEQGVTTICLTPHFYHFKEDIESFIQRRKEAFEKIKPLGETTGIKFVLGSEVYFDESILYLEDLRPLCLNEGRYILLELPFDVSINSSWIQKIIKLKVNKQVTPILAHVDRYPKIANQPDVFDELLGIGCKIQMNLSAIDSGIFKRKKWINRIKDGEIHALGSDCHNMDTRPPAYKIYSDQIKKAVDPSVFDNITQKEFFAV